MKTKPCKECGSPFHTAWFHKPHKPLTSDKPMNKIGRVGKETASAVAKWKRQQKPNHEGYFICYMCGKWIDYLEAEHAKSKTRRPDLRTDINNLKPTCSDCNEKKGSRNIEDLTDGN